MKEFGALAAAASVLLPRLRDGGINVNEGMGVGGARGRENAVRSEGGGRGGGYFLLKSIGTTADWS